ncbi:MAG: hypothetical protein COB84_09875, partial [Rhodobacteraceae bacterium]
MDCKSVFAAKRAALRQRRVEQDKQAETWYKKAIKVHYAEQNAKAYYYLADVLKEQGKYDEALIEFQNYVGAAPEDKHGAAGVESCKLAAKWKNAPTDHEINNEVLLNSKQYD